MDLISLEWLYLQSNQLTSAPYETYRSVLNTLQILDLHENPFHCNCQILWFKDWMKDVKSSVVNMPRETRCETPPHLKGKAIAYVTNKDLGCLDGDTSSSDVVSIKTIYIFFLLIVLWR
ncbi:Leucine-rich repeat-containing protein 4B, partial [Stegodyphus mimosarum]